MFGWFGKKKNKSNLSPIKKEKEKKTPVQKNPRRKLDPSETTNFHGTKIDDKLMNELIGLSLGIIADGVVDQREAETLHKWLISNKSVVNNPILNNILKKVEGYLEDGILDNQESLELFTLLQKFAGADFEIGELRKATRMPIDSPVPSIKFKGMKFCFTGKFSYGTRRDCEAATSEIGGECQSRITNDTDYLVIGIYISEAWIHTSSGRKIERAVKMKEEGKKIKIIGEEDWVKYIKELSS